VKHIYEWTDSKYAMRSALRSLNDAIMVLKDVEESALGEARRVKEILDHNETIHLTREWLTDALHQASIDYQTNKGF
jgi:hypothetical protein